ncbi:alpha/beta hydrolase [uncultured Draconibacterium sp.]|uniref:alpha/beta fold hydrolase n=1 Tax=uncultured Draconibacterium sp. TaxID=1573823 RepID=UPI003260A44C
MVKSRIVFCSSAKNILATILCVAYSVCCFGEQKKHVYFIPGQGADARLFKNIELDSTCKTIHITYSIPEKGWDMSAYARELAKQIDTTKNYSIVGVSLGGMLATEMADFLNPEKVIVISSAKNRKEFPGRYRFQKVIPIHRLVPGFAIKTGARILQPIVEPDRNKDKETFKSMLKSKNPVFLKRTTTMILTWERTSNNKQIMHIHGDNDKTLPARFVHFDYLVEDGSHMMALTRGDMISELINEILQK